MSNSEVLTDDESSYESDSQTSNRRSNIPSADVTIAESNEDVSSDESSDGVMIKRPQQSKSIAQSESEDDSDESIIRTKRKNRRAIISSDGSENDNNDDDDDDDDESDDEEERALSPHTRMSITGIRPKDLPNDTSESDYKDDSDYEDESEDDEKKKTSKDSFMNNTSDNHSIENEFPDLSIYTPLHKCDKSYTESSGTTYSNASGPLKVSFIHPDSTLKRPLQSPMSRSCASQKGSSDNTYDNGLGAMNGNTPVYRSYINPNSSLKVHPHLREPITKSYESEKESSNDTTESDNSNVSKSESEINNKNAHTSKSEYADKLSSNIKYKSKTASINDNSIDNNNSTIALQSNAMSKSIVDDLSISKQRYTMHFENAIKKKLSSTPQKKNASSEESDIMIISNREPTIEISSSDDDDIQKNTIKKPISASTPTAARLIQPKITYLLENNQSNNIDFKYVSQQFYDKEKTKMADLAAEKLSAERLIEKIGPNLPDGGQQLKMRIERLNTDIEIKAKYISSLKVDDGSGIDIQMNKPSGSKKAFFNQNAPDWDELSEAVNQIQPKYTGRQGMATFNNQKALTVDRLKDLHGSLENCPHENVLADDPKGLRVKLMDHQKHALAWMGWREKQKPRGGILADDMGLGKTLTMLSLVLMHKNEDDEAENDSDSDGNQGSSSWKSKGRRDYYPGGTLVICPASLLRQWENEINTKVSSHKLTICLHHGNNRDTKPKHLRTYDIVATTYQIVAREHKTGGTLFGLKWNRIILDEAHVIRNHKSLSSIACCGLRAKNRWALTGTPIQNKEMDLFALLKFLHCSPFDDLPTWKKWIDKSAGGQQRLNTVMKSLMLRRTKVQLQEIGKLESLPEKKVEIVEVKLNKAEMNVYQKIMVYSRTLFAQFLLQQADRDTARFMPESYMPSHLQKKDANEAYFHVHQKFTKLYRSKEDVKSHDILVLLLRLRQICCHPGLIDAMLEDVNNETKSNLDSSSLLLDHDIDLLDQLQKLRIGDDNSSDVNDNDSIDDNTKRIAKASANILQRNNPVFDLKRPSTKMLKILEKISNITKNTESNDKAIIVSQWTSVLNILNEHLQQQGIKTLSLNGSIAVKDRQNIVNELNNEKSKVKVLLLSLTAGGVGLNLVGANHLILVDLHWNPQLEAQAQDRVYRVGQKKNVYIYKFMCTDTVEERIKALQDHKLAVANGILTGSKIQGSKLTMDDLKSLFAM